jgi:hypothetical protein
MVSHTTNDPKLATQRAFFDQLATTLKVEKHTDWNAVDVNTVIEKGGSFIVSDYKGSLYKGT